MPSLLTSLGDTWQVGLLLVLGSGLQENDANLVADFAASVKREFARNILWSRVDVDAGALRQSALGITVAAAHASASPLLLLTPRGLGIPVAAAHASRPLHRSLTFELSHARSPPHPCVHLDLRGRRLPRQTRIAAFGNGRATPRKPASARLHA